MTKFDANAITWFEIPTSNFERATKFYEAALGTGLRPWPGKEPCSLFPICDGGVGGCLVYRPQQKPTADGTIVFLNVDGMLARVLERAVENGGKLLVPRTTIEGGHGAYAVFLDSEGNHVGLHTR